MHVTISNLEFMYIDRHLICDVNLLNSCDVNLLNIYMVTQREFAYLQGK